MSGEPHDETAELGPDAETFEDLLADNVVLVDQGGTPALAKRKVVEAHRAGKGPKFVTCTGHSKARNGAGP